MSDIQYKSRNGYSGALFGKSSLIVYDPKSVICFHTGSRKINTYEELVDFVESYPEFEAKLEILWEDRQCM